MISLLFDQCLSVAPGAGTKVSKAAVGALPTAPHQWPEVNPTASSGQWRAVPPARPPPTLSGR